MESLLALLGGIDPEDRSPALQSVVDEAVVEAVDDTDPSDVPEVEDEVMGGFLNRAPVQKGETDEQATPLETHAAATLLSREPT